MWSLKAVCHDQRKGDWAASIRRDFLKDPPFFGDGLEEVVGARDRFRWT
ncbi:MAG: hypothetical protein ABI557_17160 [Aureliella sp.]